LGGRKCDFAVVVVDLVWFSLFSFFMRLWVLVLVCGCFGFILCCADHEIVLVVFQ
jgi:hypothetical protein